MRGLRSWVKRRRTEPSPESRRETVIFLFLFLLAFLPYANTLFNDFVYDDSFQVVENPYVHSFRYLRQIFTTTVWSFQGAQGVTNYFRPMMTFLYLLTYQIAGTVPFSFHLTNLVLNGVVVWLVFYLVRRFSGERVALIAAGLFALHPIHTESVAWIAAVTDLELSLFYLATFLLYLKLPETDYRWRARAVMCVTFALALLSKEQAMTLPVVVTIFEYFYRDDRAMTSMKEKASRYGPLWGMAALYFVVRAIVLGGVASVVSRPNLSWYETCLSAVSLVGGYLGKLVWPAHLSAFYVFHPSHHVTDTPVLIGLAGIAVCAILFVVLWKRVHLISFALVWMFLPLGPVLNARWMPASVFAERYLYLPSVGYCWLLGWAAAKLWNVKEPKYLRPLAHAVPALVGVAALILAVKTVRRNRDWRSDEVLFRQSIQAQGDASLIHSNLGAIYLNRGDKDAAEREYLEALSVGATNVFALDNMAILRQQQHRYAESLDYSWRALRARPVFANGHVDLAETLALMGRTAEAEWQYRVATAISPLSTRAHNAYGKFLYEAGRLEDARTEYERSVQADPTSDAYDRLGDIYLNWRDMPRAEQSFRHALHINPFDGHAHIGLGQVLEFAGHPGDALHEYESGLAMDPSDPIARAGVIRIRGKAPSKELPQ
jgi:Tfp pilus assembly protein PilF